MKCLYCQGKMKKGTAPFHIDRKGCHVMLDEVPAWICTQCGEIAFEDKAVDAVQDLITSIDKKTSTLTEV